MSDLLFEIGLALAAKGSREQGKTLHRELVAAIVDGRLKPGTRLPATRSAQRYFKASRNTVAEVYERLANEGFVATRQGSGTYVAGTLPKKAPRAAAKRKTVNDPRLNKFWLRADVTAAMGFWRDQSEGTRGAAAIDFRPALVDTRLFPHDVFRKVSAKQLRGLERKPASNKSPQGNQGNYALRDAIIKHIALTRSVVCRPDDILVTAGAQQAFDLIARVLVTSGETVVAIEDPGYPPMRVAFAAAGAKVVPVGVDAEGLIVEQLPPDVGVICVCPSHQFPLGVTMSARRRKALIAFARKRGAVIVEDDYDGEFRYEGSFVEALRTADAADVVFYVGTFSKCMLPSLRLGFVAAPDWAMKTLVAAKNAMDWHCPVPVQTAVAGFIAGGHLTRHVRKMRQTYKARRDLLLKTLQETLAGGLEPVPSFYGMHVSVIARDKADFDAVSEALARANVKIHALSRYYLGTPAQSGLIFGYGATGLGEIARGLSLLDKVLRDTGR